MDDELDEGLIGLELKGATVGEERASVGMAGAGRQWNTLLRTPSNHSPGHTSTHESLDYDQIHSQFDRERDKEFTKRKFYGYSGASVSVMLHNSISGDASDRLLVVAGRPLGAHRRVRVADRPDGVRHEQGHREHHELEDAAAHGADQGRLDAKDRRRRDNRSVRWVWRARGEHQRRPELRCDAGKPSPDPSIAGMCY